MECISADLIYCDLIPTILKIYLQNTNYNKVYNNNNSISFRIVILKMHFALYVYLYI